MPYKVIIHMHNDDPILGEIDELPAPSDTIVTLMNPRRRDGKDVHYLQPDVITVIWPVSQISFIEVLPTDGVEPIVSHVKD